MSKVAMGWTGATLTAAVVLLVGVLVGAEPPAGDQQNPYRLKQPNQAASCLACHTDFEEKLKKPVVHAAVASGECWGCHDPHVSDHPTLLSGDTREICARCHGEVIPENAKSTHQVVAEGECRQCHDPHASDNPALLVEKSDTLCFTCHADIGDTVTTARFGHAPVREGCSTCHDPHGSAESVKLLKDDGPALCTTCHEPDGPAFVSQHQQYPVAQAACTSCHDPHGSNQPALLLNTVHAPLQGGTCNQCHEGPNSSVPFATKAQSYELCRGCHADMVNVTMAKRRLHWPAADKTGCVNCHNPHASNVASLLKADGPELCSSCHSDTLARIGAVSVKHAPVDAGMCVSCHSPHASEGVNLIDQPSVITLCSQCHDYETHSAHPIGEEAIDPRNKNLQVDCLSCHRGHGTNFTRMRLAETDLELCTACHRRIGR
jgi:DmsE family decaheme c-type cytochrome